MTNLEKWRNYQIDFFDDNDEIVDSINTNELIDVIEKQEKILNYLKKHLKFDSVNPMGKRWTWWELDIHDQDYEDLMEWLGR